MADRARPVARAWKPALGVALAALALAVGWQATAGTSAARAAVVHFRGQEIHAPASWPVYRISEHPRMCVRLDRRAVYLGTPSVSQRCPAHAVGRQRAILVEGGASTRAAQASARASTASGGATTPGASTTASGSGSLYTGLGFDACSAPSSRTMSAWALSPYRAIGVYIGGANRACSQPNLTASWVGAQIGAGWHLIPTYVGLQAPTSSCSSCAKLGSSTATGQGTAAAEDAVADAQSVGIGPGNPIYFDMEAYTRTAAASAATLTFLEAWTRKLHALGYLSGVYSSSGSGIADLGDAVGSGYLEPDDLWIANWNGQQSTADPAVPAGAFTPHRRIHQYRGGHNESYGGITINIDNDYVDAATVGTAFSNEDDPLGRLELAGSPSPGQVRVKGWALDPNAPTQPLSIRLVVGGKAGEPRTNSYELGAVASRSRPDVAAKFPEAGGLHGFDAAMATLKSGRQRVCVYALDVAPGSDRILGCRGTTIPVAILLSRLRAIGNRIRVRVACEWPAGTECPGQIILRTRFRVPVPHYSGHGPRTRPISRVLGRHAFVLTGKRAHTFNVPLSGGGRALLQARGRLRTQVLVAIPCGHRIRTIDIGEAG
jgi:hypothetical protein